jgi:dTDP-4-dehydrorhamnose 3,5-epimerase
VNVVETRLPGVLVIEPRVFRDARGFFLESWHRDRYAEIGIDRAFVQDNVSYSTRGVLRGLHFQNPMPQAKLVSVLHGEIFDVAVDVRSGSPTFGQWVGETLCAESMRQLLIPEGFAHGFVVTGDSALVSYKCTERYFPEYDRCIRWEDPEIGIDWPVLDPALSEKDRSAPRLVELDKAQLHRFSHGGAKRTGTMGSGLE